MSMRDFPTPLGYMLKERRVKSLLESIAERVLVCDGAMGTELQARGLPADACQEWWNVERPDEVRAVHRCYLEAGAELILTNTFGANRLKLAKRGLGDRVAEFNRAGATVALEAAAGKAYVLGDVGPTGELIAPLGTVSSAEVEEAFAAQVAALAGAGVQAIIVETMMSVAEAVLATKAARQACKLPVLASMSFQKGRRDYRTLMGETVAQAVAALVEAGADVVGTNCGGGTADAVAVVAEMARHTDRPLLAEPNAGVPTLEGTRTVFREAPDQWAARLPELLKAGVRILGGCCGTTPEHIRRVRELLDGKGHQTA